MIVTVALLVLGITAVLQIYFRLKFFRHLGLMNGQDEYGILQAACSSGPAAIPVSVIICAHNEAENLRHNLPAVLQQNYFFEDGRPAFEVIVVNDASTDGSDTVLRQLLLDFPVLKIVEIDRSEPREFPGKKFALSRGIAAAAHEVIVCTDADCEPASELWLQAMAAPFLRGKSIVAGYGGYRTHPGWLNRFIRFETMHTFFLYYSFWKGGAPYMAVGRNMAARKSVYEEAAKSPAWSELPSGDDDLLIQRCATTANMAVVAFPGSFTWSEPKRTVDEYVAQKRRHVSTGKFYNRRSRHLLGAYALLTGLRMLTPLLVALVWWLSITGETIGGVVMSGFSIIFAATIAVCGPRFSEHTSTLRERSHPADWILFSFCWLIYNAVLAPWILWKTKQRWK